MIMLDLNWSLASLWSDGCVNDQRTRIIREVENMKKAGTPIPPAIQAAYQQALSVVSADAL